MTDQELFEVAAKLHNVRPDQLRLKRRYLDVIVIEMMDGAKHTYFVVDLEAITMDGFAVAAGEVVPGLAPEPETSKKPQHTRKR
jgi:hypothetical protein